MRFVKSSPITEISYGSAVTSRAPSNISYMWNNFGIHAFTCPSSSSSSSSSSSKSRFSRTYSPYSSKSSGCFAFGQKRFMLSRIYKAGTACARRTGPAYAGRKNPSLEQQQDYSNQRGYATRAEYDKAKEETNSELMKAETGPLAGHFIVKEIGNDDFFYGLTHCKTYFNPVTKKLVEQIVVDTTDLKGQASTDKPKGCNQNITKKTPKTTEVFREVNEEEIEKMPPETMRIVMQRRHQEDNNPQEVKNFEKKIHKIKTSSKKTPEQKKILIDKEIAQLPKPKTPNPSDTENIKDISGGIKKVE